SSSRLVSNPSSNPTPSTNPNLPPIVMMADQRTMGQLLQAPTKGYEDAIVVPAIIIISTLKFPNVPNTSIKLMLFPFSLEGAARIWLEKEPPRSIFTWDDLVSKFINQFFPPSKTTNLRNELTNFQQRFDESFSEAWDRFKDLLRACPHHGFSKLHQLDTIYNVLNSKDQDSLNFTAGGNFLDKMPPECLDIIESKSKVRYSRNKSVVAKDMVKAILLDKKSQNQAPATVKAIEESCVTYGGAHSYRNCPATNGNVYHDNIQEFVSQASAVNYNQGNTSYRPPMIPVYQLSVFQPPAYQAPAYKAPAPQTQGVSKEDFPAYVKANDAVMRNMQTQGQNMQNQLTNLTELLTKFVNTNSASTLSSGTLPSNTIANPRSDLKAITTRSGVSYDGPQIPPPPSFLPKVMENEPEATKDTMHPTNNESTEDNSTERTPLDGPPKEVARKTGSPDKFLIPCDFLRKAECLALADIDASINLMPLSMWNKLSLPNLTLTYMNLELADRLISRPVGVAEDVYVKVGTFHFSADFVVVDFDADPRVPLFSGDLSLRLEEL
nr:reverse transcriptase domain-containing protein [Tanacetum cinerariifolium]